MDEADVVLEARSIEDFRRNAVVTSKYGCPWSMNYNWDVPH
jgi:hypothetical protein